MRNAEAKTDLENKLRPRLIRLRELMERTALSRSEVYRRLKLDPEFPKPIPLGKRNIAFIEAEVDRYLEERIAKRDARRAA